jgi:hypothetical protein
MALVYTIGFGRPRNRQIKAIIKLRAIPVVPDVARTTTGSLIASLIYDKVTHQLWFGFPANI